MVGSLVLPPYPNGWFLLAFADELPPGSVLSRTFMGQEVVLFRTASLRAAAVDAYCPHLGAHLGAGGRVDGEVLRCPFHGFCYDADGNCVRTGYGTKPPPSAVLSTWPLVETDGMILLWHHVAGAAPDWRVPSITSDGWTRPRYRRFVLFDHPQETTENSVDLGHFAFVHGYREARMLRDLEIEGPYLSTAYSVRRPLVPGRHRWLSDRSFEFQFETRIWGLGHSSVEVTVPVLGVHMRLWVLPTPIDERRIRLYLASSVRHVEPSANHPKLGWFPTKMVTAVLARALMAGFVHDTRQDFPIWQNKRYVHPPALAAGDGPIGRYRKWARQFYVGAPVSDSEVGMQEHPQGERVGQRISTSLSMARRPLMPRAERSDS